MKSGFGDSFNRSFTFADNKCDALPTISTNSECKTSYSYWSDNKDGRSSQWNETGNSMFSSMDRLHIASSLPMPENTVSISYTSSVPQFGHSYGQSMMSVPTDHKLLLMAIDQTSSNQQQNVLSGLQTRTSNCMQPTPMYAAGDMKKPSSSFSFLESANAPAFLFPPSSIVPRAITGQHSQQAAATTKTGDWTGMNSASHELKLNIGQSVSDIGRSLGNMNSTTSSGANFPFDFQPSSTNMHKSVSFPKVPPFSASTGLPYQRSLSNVDYSTQYNMFARNNMHAVSTCNTCTVTGSCCLW